MTRIEAAVKAWDHYWGDRYGDEALEEMGEEVKVALAASDAHDTAHGVARLRVDDEAVERAAEALLDGDRSWCECRRSPFDKHDVNPPCSTRTKTIETVRAVIDALKEEA